MKEWFLKIKRLKLIALFVVNRFIFIGLLLPLLGAKPSPQIDYNAHTTTEAFKEITDLVRQEYVDKVDEKKMLEGALNGMLGALDPHSSYMNVDEYKDLLNQTKGEFGGLGMEVTMENGLVKIVAPIDDTPAFKAGLKEKDLIVAINNEPVFGLTLTEAVKKMRGEPKTTVSLLIKREGKDPFEVVLKRELIKIKSVKWEAVGDVGYIRIATFDEKTDSLLKEAIADLKKTLGDKLLGVVLDLRNNPGGLLEQAIAVSDLFLNKGVIVSTRGRDPQKNIYIQVTPKQDILNGLPIVVLINGGSASASEIVAGALQDNHRAIIIGTASFGKGSVQQIRPLNNGGAIKITISRYYTPSGISIQAKGIHPDVIVEQVMDLAKIDEDRIREKNYSGSLKAEETPGETQKETLPPEPKKESSVPSETSLLPKNLKEKVVDYQRLRAIEFVQGLNVYGKNLKSQSQEMNVLQHQSQEAKVR